MADDTPTPLDAPSDNGASEEYADVLAELLGRDGATDNTDITLTTLDVPQRFKAGKWTVFGSRNIQVTKPHRGLYGGDDPYLAGPRHTDRMPDWTAFSAIAGCGYEFSSGTLSIGDDLHKSAVALSSEWIDAFLLPTDSHHLQNFLRRRIKNVLLIGLSADHVTQLTDVVLSMRDGCEHVQILGDHLEYLCHEDNPPPIDFSKLHEHFHPGTPKPLMVFVVEPRSSSPQVSKVVAYCLSADYIDFFQELLVTIKREWNILQGSQSAQSPYAGFPPGWTYEALANNGGQDGFRVAAKLIVPLDEENFIQQHHSETLTQNGIPASEAIIESPPNQLSRASDTLPTLSLDEARKLFVEDGDYWIAFEAPGVIENHHDYLTGVAALHSLAASPVVRLDSLSIEAYRVSLRMGGMADAPLVGACFLRTWDGIDNHIYFTALSKGHFSRLIPLIDAYQSDNNANVIGHHPQALIDLQEYQARNRQTSGHSTAYPPFSITLKEELDVFAAWLHSHVQIWKTCLYTLPDEFQRPERWRQSQTPNGFDWVFEMACLNDSEEHIRSADCFRVQANKDESGLHVRVSFVGAKETDNLYFALIYFIGEKWLSAARAAKAYSNQHAPKIAFIESPAPPKATSTERKATRAKSGNPGYEADEWARQEHFTHNREPRLIFLEWQSKRRAEMEQKGRGELADWQDTWRKVLKLQPKDKR